MKRHRTAVVLTAVGILGMIAYSVYALTVTDLSSPMYREALLMIVFCVGTCLGTYPQRVVVSEGVVTIRSGLFVVNRILLTGVNRVYASKGWPLSHTLYPVTGWRLSVGKKEILVIPEDEAGFFEEVLRQAPHLRRYGNELRGKIDSSESALPT